jgi:hypothetical protein
MAMGRYPDRTIPGEAGATWPFSDIGGLTIRLNNSPGGRPWPASCNASAAP